jgi:hypothetical protein
MKEVREQPTKVGGYKKPQLKIHLENGSSVSESENDLLNQLLVIAAALAGTG